MIHRYNQNPDYRVDQEATIEAIAKKWERRFLHGEPGQNKNTCADKPHLYTIAEQAVEGYRNVDLRNLRKVKIGGKLYEFEE